MENLYAEAVTLPHLPIETITLRLILATFLGAAIGVEREWRGRPAGLRTHILVALASALFAVLTLEIAHAEVIQDESIRADPIRVIEAVTAGVAFLAAGAIIQARGSVKGLTTGAGLWLAGAVGVACGLGLWSIAVLAVGIGLIVLFLLGHLERAVTERREE